LIEKAIGKRMIILAPWMKAKASVLREENRKPGKKRI